MYLRECSEWYATVLAVVQLGADDNVTWAVGGGDTSCQGGCVEPHQGGGQDLDDHS